MSNDVNMKGPRLSSAGRPGKDPKFWTPNKTVGAAPISSGSIDAAQMTPTNRRHRTMNSQGEGASNASFKGFGPTLK